ncbi:MAG: 2-isopropylmalate synthase [Spirochaetales bacterium]|nr:2-isopropylmalate synthase [Spirochaetales bacterium]
MARRIHIFDTTLRDGEQAPRCSMNVAEKLEVARQLEKLGVAVMEAGFPAASPGDLAAVREIAGCIKNARVAALARATEPDIEAAWEALRKAESPRMHTFIATSPIHMQSKLRMTPAEVVAQAEWAVRHARRYCSDVEFSAEDASRSDPEFLCQVFAAAVRAGATVINIPDTVGYATPGEFSELVALIASRIRDIAPVQISVHCHNDLGLAVANSLAAIQAGADQVECTINGLGERAGNAALEEIVMALHTRHDLFDCSTGIVTNQIFSTSRLVSKVTGVPVQINKAIVGDNAFAHEAGIHQHGVLANRSTYEIMTPESIGLPRNTLVLGKHSGRHAFEARLVHLGFSLSPDEINRVFAEFKILADRKKLVTDRDIEALARGASAVVPETWQLERFAVHSGSGMSAACNVCLVHKDGSSIEKTAVGDGPVDAAFKAIDAIVDRSLELEDFKLTSVTAGEDAQGEAMVRIRNDGKTWNGHGLSTDILEASIKAYLSAINTMIWEEASYA